MPIGCSAEKRGREYIITDARTGSGGLGRRLLWFAGLYVAGVVITGVLAWLIRLMVRA